VHKMKVQNPLTIIALFAGIAEVAGTVVLLGLPLEIQRIFVWFTIGFPIAIVAAFFCILVTRPEVLYGPGDYENEEIFYKLMIKANADIGEIISKVEKGTDESELKEKLKDVQQNISAAAQIGGNIKVRRSEKFEKIIEVLEKNPQGLTIDEIVAKVGYLPLPNSILNALILGGKVYKKGDRFFLVG